MTSLRAGTLGRGSGRDSRREGAGLQAEGGGSPGEGAGLQAGGGGAPGPEAAAGADGRATVQSPAAGGAAMAGCCSVLRSFLFEYDTPRIVLIRSRKVGLMNRAVQLFILAYVIG